MLPGLASCISSAREFRGFGISVLRVFVFSIGWKFFNLRVVEVFMSCVLSEKSTADGESPCRGGDGRLETVRLQGYESCRAFISVTVAPTAF